MFRTSIPWIILLTAGWLRKDKSGEVAIATTWQHHNTTMKASELLLEKSLFS